MKFTTAIASVAAAASFASAAAIDQEQLTNGTYIDIPQESILSFLDLTDSPEVSVYPIKEGSKTGLIFVNSTIVDQAYSETTALTRKREAVAEADPWAWIRMWPGGVMFTKRDAEAEAEAEADPWAWIRMWPGGVMFTKRDAEAEADAEPWAWIRMWPGGVMFT
ncbi:hypothetical protein ACO0OE_003715 [Hanseniaspora uvarum]|uniref:Mating factor alpha-1 n=1 Tax=Hanseniaspora uvarum TaxID=29833 RepID=A0A1E5RQF6_HANUV|nr:Mating factor alpha-1 [Hanseniaspora uvarum]GMM42702.1 Mf(Alpha)1 protein [Hanseniaspora uvarum]